MKYHSLYKYAKYLISGGSAAFVNIGSLYLLTEYGHVYYLLSATLAFVCGFVVSFTLQKYWTFQDSGHAAMKRQVVLYFIVSLANLAFNIAFIYVLVEYLHLWYIAAAFLSGLCIAFVSFFIYRRFIFIALPHETL